MCVLHCWSLYYYKYVNLISQEINYFEKFNKLKIILTFNKIKFILKHLINKIIKLIILSIKLIILSIKLIILSILLI